MLISLVTLLSTIVFLKGAESTLFEPEKHCVPTATVRGPCHVCICSHDGVFHCRPKPCEYKNVGRSRPKADCIPNSLYRQENTFCRCGKDGFWMSNNCEATFKNLYPKTNFLMENLMTNITCTANKHFLIDCNICLCPESGIIDVKLCTSRSCINGHKAERCSYGDVLRVGNELCSCSDIDFYIDRLCIKILDEEIQPLDTEDILKIENIGKVKRRVTFRASSESNNVCDPNVVYAIDCNNCICLDGRPVCTQKVCETNAKTSLRQRINELDALPELESNAVNCDPGKKYRSQCNVCTCTMNGSPSCTTMVCLENHVLDLKALRGVLTSANVKLEEIKYGDKCTYGKKYRMDCNTCHCGHENNLLCSKAACFNPKESEMKEHAVTVDKRSKFDSEKVVNKKKKAGKAVGRENANPQSKASSGFPALPKSETCTPGRIYQEGCHRCFCNSDKKAECSSIDACKQQKAKRDLEPVDLRPKIKDQEFEKLPELPHAATPCTPGITYKVDCNGCVCDENQNLLCDKLLCISFKDMHRAEAVKKSGLPCNSDNFVENDVIQSQCIVCSCNGTTHCKAKDNCMADAEKMLRSRRNGSSLAFDYTEEKCVPEHIYKDNCNRCYCQDDQTLRCTQKTCLNYKQAVILEMQQKYLQEHGL